MGASWVSRFLDRNYEALARKWTSGMDRNRHKADSYTKYEQYFELLHSKMIEYDIQRCNSYNMDEKGFIISVLGRSKRVFSCLL